VPKTRLLIAYKFYFNYWYLKKLVYVASKCYNIHTVKIGILNVTEFASYQFTVSIDTSTCIN